MKLDDFIKNALIDISNGLKSSNDEIDKKRQSKSGEQLTKVFALRPGSELDKGQGISFDVAVTIEKSGDVDAGVNISVASFSLGGKLSGKNQTVSRIQFVINTSQWHG